MKSTIAFSAAVSVLISAVTVLAYDRAVARPSQQIGVVDLSDVYRSKEAEFAKLVTASGNDDDRRAAHESAAQFARRLPTALEELPAECKCLVMLRSAVVGRTPNVIDLTAALKLKLDGR